MSEPRTADDTWAVAKQLGGTIAARRQHIQDNAPCVDCGSPLTDCKASRGKDPTAPEWFGCCASGITLNVPCRHRVDANALLALIGEIESGTVRTVEEVTVESQRTRAGSADMSWLDYLNQGQVWHPSGKPPVVIADMDLEWRYNAAQWLDRRAYRIGLQHVRAAHAWLAVQLSSPLGPSKDAADSLERDIDDQSAEIERDPVAWIRTTELYRALVADLPTKSKEVAALVERARHWSACPARTGTEDCRCSQIRAEHEAAAGTTPEWTT